MTEIIPGIHQLKVPIPDNPLEYTNVYLVQGDGENLLIDTGWNSEDALQSLKQQLNEIGISPKDISQVVVTHAHGDHYGLAGRLKELSSATINLHHLEEGLLVPRYQNMDEFLSQTEQWFLSHGVPAHEIPTSWPSFAGAQRPAAPIQPDNTLHGGETISAGMFKLQVIWTPGHSQGHVCLYEPIQKLFFSGDHVLPVITPNISLQPQSNMNPLSDFINSLNMVAQLDVNLVLPAHENIFTDLRKRVTEIIEHHNLRNSEILEAMKAGAKTAYDISTRITWMPELGGVRFKDLAQWDKRMAVSETLAHLEAMIVNGKVDKFHKDSNIYYEST